MNDVNCDHHWSQVAMSLKYDPATAGTDPVARTLQLALDALEDARDDVLTCKAHADLLGGYPRTDRVIAEYAEQLQRHDAAIAALRDILGESAEDKLSLKLENQRIGEELQRACAQLPEGFTLRVVLERGCGQVEVHGPEGDEVELPPTRERLSDQIGQAIDAAKG